MPEKAQETPKKTAAKKAATKTAAVKTPAKKAATKPVAVVPAEVKPPAPPSHHEISQRAYEIYQRRGHSHHDPNHDWLQAEHELRHK